MTEYIKIGSDRPDYRQTLRDQADRAVDLRDAVAVQINVWVDDDVLMIDAPATVEAGRLGVVSYDFDRTEITTAGSALIEFRVEWANGDEQWFPTDARGSPLEIVPPPGDRDGQPTHGDGILTVDPGEVYTVEGTERYARVDNAGEIVVGDGDELIV